jgi:hypothetical protein
MASLLMCPDELDEACGGMNGAESLCAGSGLKSGGYEITGSSHMGKKNCNIAVSNIKNGCEW